MSPRNTSSLAPCEIPCAFTGKKGSCHLRLSVFFVVVLDSNEYLRPDPRLLLSSFLLMKHFSSYKSFLKSLDREPGAVAFVFETLPAAKFQRDEKGLRSPLSQRPTPRRSRAAPHTHHSTRCQHQSRGAKRWLASQSVTVCDPGEHWGGPACCHPSVPPATLTRQGPHGKLSLCRCPWEEQRRGASSLGAVIPARARRRGKRS